MSSLGWIKEIIAKEGGGYLFSRSGMRREPIHWGDMDSMRHVNNVVYLKKFEAARINYLLQLEKLHLGTDKFLSAKGVGPIMRSLNIDWKYPVRYPDDISIFQKLSRIEKDRFHIKGILVAHGPKVLASRVSEIQVTVDYTREPTTKAPIPSEWREAFEEEMAAQERWEDEFEDLNVTRWLGLNKA